MTPQDSIPIIRTADELEDILTSSFKGVAYVKLNRGTITFLLSINRNNRKIKELSVKSYMESFEKFGYESIALMTIDETGVLADGQHRLIALDRLMRRGWDIPEIWQMVNIGLDKKRTEDIDNGVVRTYSDTLKMHGVVDDKLIASALRQYCGLFDTRTIKKTARAFEEVYNEDFYKVLEIGNFKTLENSEILTSHSYRPPSWVIAGFRICQQVYGTENMKQVYKQMYNGNTLTEPMVKFRNWLLVNRRSIHFSAQTKEARNILGYFFYAVKKCLDGESISRLYSVKLGANIKGFDF